MNDLLHGVLAWLGFFAFCFALWLPVLMAAIWIANHH